MTAERLAVISFDVEQDCPPYLSTTRGMEEGLPRLLDLLAEKRVKATFFFTGEMAEKYPGLARRVVDEGHELGCHGYRHERFDHMSPGEAEWRLKKALTILRSFSDEVVAFRAPNLQRPEWMLPLLRRLGFRIDSSIARYKPPFPGPRPWVEKGVTVVPVSVTSSVLRLPWRLQRLIHSRLSAPRVYFSHPWEYVDMSRAPVRWDCKFNTGERALSLLSMIIDWLQRSNWRLVTLGQLAELYAFQ